MVEYALYLESGPRKRKTMVHVLDLLGCIARGATTEEALEATPGEIRRFQGFLKRYGEMVEPDKNFSTVVAAHVMEGNWLANGDPTPGFAPDFQPLTTEDLAIYLRRLSWMHADLTGIIQSISEDQLVVEPMDGSRSIFHILSHVAESHANYLRMTVGKVEGLKEALLAITPDVQLIQAALSSIWNLSIGHMETLSDIERTQAVAHGQTIWTARRGVRRMLEHQWEHLQEIRERLGLK